MSKNYTRNLIVATKKAAKVTGCDASELRKHFRDFKNAPSELKHGLIVTYRIMNSYAKAVVPAVEG